MAAWTSAGSDEDSNPTVEFDGVVFTSGFIGAAVNLFRELAERKGFQEESRPVIRRDAVRLGLEAAGEHDVQVLPGGPEALDEVFSGSTVWQDDVGDNE